MGWKWNSDTSLSFDIDTTDNEKPGSIVVHCYDWGANGTLTVTIRKKTGSNTWVDVGEPLTKSIPYDEANENQILELKDDVYREQYEKNQKRWRMEHANAWDWSNIDTDTA